MKQQESKWGMHVELSRHDSELKEYAYTIERGEGLLRQQPNDLSGVNLLDCDALTAEVVFEVLDEL